MNEDSYLNKPIDWPKYFVYGIKSDDGKAIFIAQFLKNELDKAKAYADSIVNGKKEVTDYHPKSLEWEKGIKLDNVVIFDGLPTIKVEEDYENGIYNGNIYSKNVKDSPFKHEVVNIKDDVEEVLGHEISYKEDDSFYLNNHVLSLTSREMWTGRSAEFDYLVKEDNQDSIFRYYESNFDTKDLSPDIYKSVDTLKEQLPPSAKIIAQNQNGAVVYNEGTYEFYRSFNYKEVQEKYGTSAIMRGTVDNDGSSWYRPSDDLIDVLQEIANHEHDKELKRDEMLMKKFPAFKEEELNSLLTSDGHLVTNIKIFKSVPTLHGSSDSVFDDVVCLTGDCGNHRHICTVPLNLLEEYESGKLPLTKLCDKMFTVVMHNDPTLEEELSAYRSKRQGIKETFRQIGQKVNQLMSEYRMKKAAIWEPISPGGEEKIYQEAHAMAVKKAAEASEYLTKRDNTVFAQVNEILGNVRDLNSRKNDVKKHPCLYGITDYGPHVPHKEMLNFSIETDSFGIKGAKEELEKYKKAIEDIARKNGFEKVEYHFYSGDQCTGYIQVSFQDFKLEENRSLEEHINNNSNSKVMSKKKTQPVKQEEAAQVKQDAAPVEKTAKESKKEEKVATAKEESNEKEAVKQHRPPQMITVNGDKVSHAHAFQSNKNPEDWFYTAKVNGVELRPQHMNAEDVKAWQERTLKVEDAMQHYFPTKLMPKVTKENFKAAVILSDGRKIEKFKVFKEDNEQSKDYGKYKLYAKVGNHKMFKTMTPEDLNAYFDRVTTPSKLVEKNFGEQLNLASAYAKYQIPQDAGVEKVQLGKNKDGKWEISASGSFGKTEKKVLSAQDTYSLFHTKTATREQLAAKYFSDGFKAAPEQKIAKSRSMGIK